VADIEGMVFGKSMEGDGGEFLYARGEEKWKSPVERSSRREKEVRKDRVLLKSLNLKKK